MRQTVPFWSWAAKRSQDAFRKQSKVDNYRSRAAYKLLELNQKHRFLKKGFGVIDLGFAPGSWSQVASTAVGAEGFVVAVDIQNVSPPQGVFPVYGDMLDPQTQAKIQDAFQQHRQEPKTNDLIVDTILSDMLHSTTGIRIRDHAVSMDLCNSAFQLAKTFLRPGGFFVCKYYMGSEEHEFQKSLMKVFKRVHIEKPKASVKESREAYFVCLRRK
ncbi:mitochondrial 2' O-ribose methyltransferase Mrm2 [Schizosaccharomyces osmophilus]|uniref:rRNA methyltransferase 2, mitochondrial n=1 Tax=Schizosaccharomyces osmophilus TaxID=2545709 RepID=A0AAE9WB08_9SCHI|nr:mitochondrial 2' O-ribose methyltransferase Mrm2 [Schizosaccharomyces osmophilus]WBW72929.1 mitochondrial 2' O-ribose methyltransferase Mrm2 [Schizosaccharomyces osmophilus]